MPDHPLSLFAVAMLFAAMAAAADCCGNYG